MPVQDVSDEELEDMGFQKFRIIESEDGLVIHPDDVEAFLEYDRRPLTEKEIAHLKHCREVYEKMKPRGSLGRVKKCTV